MMMEGRNLYRFDEKTRWVGFYKLFFSCSSLTFLVKIGNHLENFLCLGRLGGSNHIATLWVDLQKLCEWKM